MIFMPIVVAGCIFSYLVAEPVILLIGGENYSDTYHLFRMMIPILFFSFPAQLYGWPTLGAIGRVKETTTSTIIAAIAQVVGLFILILFNSFTLTSLAILRSVTEIVLLLVRMYFTYKNRAEFSSQDNSKQKEKDT